MPDDIELVDGPLGPSLRYRFGVPFDQALKARPDSRLLREFTRLASAPDAAIARFAARWGVLDLCQHGRPLARPPRIGIWTCRHSSMEPLVVAEDLDPRGRLNPEPLTIWRDLARRAAETQVLVVEAWAARRAGTTAHDGSDWREVYAVNLVNDWLYQADVGIELWDFRTGLRTTGWGLFAAVATQLALSVAREHELQPCSTVGCPRPARAVRRGATPYCVECEGEGARERDKAARFRERNPGYYSKAAREERSR